MGGIAELGTPVASLSCAGSVQIQEGDRAVVVLGHPLMRQGHPPSVRGSHPPAVGPVGLDHPAVVARAERRAINALRLHLRRLLSTPGGHRRDMMPSTGQGCKL